MTSAVAEPLVSVIMPVWNCEQFLTAAIDSILNQTLSDIELLIVDDGSTDGSASIAASYDDPRVVLLRQTCGGVGRARNSGMARARGKYIAFMDADDVAAPDRLALQVKFLERHPDIGAVGTWTEWIDLRGNPLSSLTGRPPSTDAAIRMEMLDDSGFMCASILCRADAPSGFHFREDLRYAEDYEWTIRLIHRVKVANLPLPLYGYRQRESSASARLDETSKRAARDRIRSEAMEEVWRSVDEPSAAPLPRNRAGFSYDDTLVRRTAYAWFLRAAATGRYRQSATFLGTAFRKSPGSGGRGVFEGVRTAIEIHRDLGVTRGLARVAPSARQLLKRRRMAL